MKCHNEILLKFYEILFLLVMKCEMSQWKILPSYEIWNVTMKNCPHFMKYHNEKFPLIMKYEMLQWKIFPLVMKYFNFIILLAL